MKVLLKFIFSLFFACLSLTVQAQSNGDKLFMEGQQLQKTMTVSSQNQAIKKFTAAKIVYTTAEKKKMCDNQIDICNNNIKSLKSGMKKNNQKKVEGPKENVDTVAEEPVKETHKNVELSLSETRLDFKYKPKDGYAKSVEVKCNYDDWEISSKPEWTTVYTTTGKFSVEVQENELDENRSGIIKVQCGDKVVDLIVNQSKAGKLAKIGNIIMKK